jgi:hypothetical protein
MILRSFNDASSTTLVILCRLAEWQDTDKLKKMCKEAVVNYFKVLLQYLPGMAEEHHIIHELTDLVSGSSF